MTNGASINEKEMFNRDLKCLLVRPASDEIQAEGKEFRNFKIELTDKIARINRRSKFIKKTLHAACDGRSLNRKNILTLQKFFDDLGGILDKARVVITCDILDSFLYSRLLVEKGSMDTKKIEERDLEKRAFATGGV